MDNQILWDNYNAAMLRLRQAVTSKSRSPGHENAIGEAYTKLMNAGEAPKLKQKYLKVKHGRTK